ncbi:hypothetical protein TNCV_1206341 [Trichonephila clavipes]|nr:hypothetical protein TNCV_1206341 [Trichonephila clavipes]
MGGCLTFSEIATRVKQDINSFWNRAPVHEWHERNHPGAVLLETGSRRDEIARAGFHSEHTQAEQLVAGVPSCPNCNVTQATPPHILTCIGCHKSQLLSRPATVLQSLKTRGFMDLIWMLLSIKWDKKQQHICDN